MIKNKLASNYKKEGRICVCCMKKIKKSHLKSLHKQTFEEQMIAEFRQFSYRVMPRLIE